jgi:hypothetical protein
MTCEYNYLNYYCLILIYFFSRSGFHFYRFLYHFTDNTISSMTKIQQVNDTLSTANDFSLKAYTSINKDFEKHTRIMKELKKDLDFIFKKIRYDILHYRLFAND